MGSLPIDRFLNNNIFYFAQILTTPATYTLYLYKEVKSKVYKLSGGQNDLYGLHAL